MNLLRRACGILALATALFGPAAAFADAKDAVRNKEGFWAIDIDDGACVASMTLQGGNIFMLRAQKGQVAFGLFGVAGPLPHGKAGRIETNADGFDFAPSYTDNDETLFYDGEFDAHALAILRQARQVRILADGRPVAVMTFEGTGFEGALDGAIACSKGESGWWGKGVGAKIARQAERPAPPDKTDIWRIVREGDSCFANAELKDGGYFMLKADAHGVSFGVGSGRPPSRGRQGSFETDAQSFEFEPSYSKDGVLFFRDYFNPDALAALRLAKDVRITVDGAEVMGAHVEGTGLDRALDAVIACGKGEAGPWGKDVKQVR